jgi:iron complex transport system permease protein
VTALAAAPRPTAPRPATPAPRRRSLGLTAFFVLLMVGLVVALIASAGSGQLPIPADEVAGSVLHRLGIDWLPLPTHPRGDDTLWSVRFPRVVHRPCRAIADAHLG